MRVSSALRRARRLAFTPIWSVYSSVHRHLQSSLSTPTKHIKIDDEERQLDQDQLEHPRSALAHMIKMVLLSLLVLILVLLLLVYIIYKPPTWLVAFMSWKNPDVLFHVPLSSSNHVVALTIDDAPSSETAKILDILKTYNAKATFFIIGSQVEPYSSILQRIHDEGHEMGNHAWRDEPSINLPTSELQQQMLDVEKMLIPNTNGLKYFRPGSGYFNKKMTEMVKGMGYRTVLGDIFPFDPVVPNAGINAAHILSMLKSGGIIILHDRRSYSPEQLEIALKGMQEKGWRAESLGGLLKIAEEAKMKKKAK
jgi:peptidoglycan/xylan/chitin deacetylase (PgdA/CDA1 family)